MTASVGVRRVRGALGIALLWGAAWAIIGGAVMEGLIDPRGEMVDMWPQVLGIVGFIGGLLFSVLLWVAGRGRSFREYSFREFGALGALAGVLQGGLAMLMVGAPLAFIGVTTVATTLAAAGSLAITRRSTAPPALGR